jgi:probable phosphoglycerate mutase
MTTLYLIRHGENDFMRQHKLAGWLPGIHLNDRGRAQAEGLVPAFEGLRLQALYSSPLERAVETAAPLARAHDLAVHRRPARRDSLRPLAGPAAEPPAPPQAVVAGAGDAVARHAAGWQSFRQAQAHRRRARAILAQHRGAVACFSHADPIKLALAHYLGQPLDLFQRLTIEPASISTLIISEGRVRVQSINDSRATRVADRG